MEKLIQKIHTPGLSSVKISSSNKNNIFDDDNKINFSYKTDRIGWWPSDHFGVIGTLQ